MPQEAYFYYYLNTGIKEHAYIQSFIECIPERMVSQKCEEQIQPQTHCVIMWRTQSGKIGH